MTGHRDVARRIVSDMIAYATVTGLDCKMKRPKMPVCMDRRRDSVVVVAQPKFGTLELFHFRDLDDGTSEFEEWVKTFTMHTEACWDTAFFEWYGHED